ncbi:MAG: peptidase E [Myxococcota bacterium]|nr:peptidase E [Myxococcota bacterium]
MRLFLASLSLAALPEFLGAKVRRVAWVPAAADVLEDGARVRALFGAMLDELGLSPLVCELDDGDGATLAARLAATDAVIVTGGDPFHLLARCRASGLDRALASAVRDGLPYVGVSAGAIVAGPSLEPCFLTSPFTPPRGLALEGLALTDRVVLPHHDRDDNRHLHALAADRFGARFALEPIDDDEALIVEAGVARRVRA